MRALSDILADPNGGQRMSGWLFCGFVLLAGIFGAGTAAVQLANGNPDWWIGLPLALIALPEGFKFLRHWRQRDAR